YVRRYPEYEDRLRRILPAMQALAEFGRSVSSARGSGAAVDGDNGGVVGTLGDYRIIRQVGRGGMGIVYEAEQISLGLPVAVKVLPFAATLDERQLQRFRNEARAAASLDHPHIVKVHAVGCERGVHYYAMQFIDGQTLEALIRQLCTGAAGESPARPPGGPP